MNLKKRSKTSKVPNTTAGKRLLRPDPWASQDLFQIFLQTPHLYCVISMPFSCLLSTKSSPIYSLFHLHFHHSIFSWFRVLSFSVYICVLSSSATHHSPFRTHLTSLCIILNLETAPSLAHLTSSDFNKDHIPSCFGFFFDFPPVASVVDQNNLEASMACSEDCLHCADLQAELEEVRAQQHTLENEQRILETWIDDQNHIINNKYRGEIDLFLHRVASLHE